MDRFSPHVQLPGVMSEGMHTKFKDAHVFHDPTGADDADPKFDSDTGAASPAAPPAAPPVAEDEEELPQQAITLRLKPPSGWPKTTEELKRMPHDRKVYFAKSMRAFMEHVADSRMATRVAPEDYSHVLAMATKLSQHLDDYEQRIRLHGAIGKLINKVPKLVLIDFHGTNLQALEHEMKNHGYSRRNAFRNIWVRMRNFAEDWTSYRRAIASATAIGPRLYTMHPLAGYDENTPMANITDIANDAFQQSRHVHQTILEFGARRYGSHTNMAREALAYIAVGHFRTLIDSLGRPPTKRMNGDIAGLIDKWQEEYNTLLKEEPNPRKEREAIQKEEKEFLDRVTHVTQFGRIFRLKSVELA